LCANLAAGGERGASSGGLGPEGPPVAELLSVLLLADLPMMILAGVILAKKQMLGLFVNLFGGVICAAVILFWLAHYSVGQQPDGFEAFVKWFITIYTALLWIAICVWSLVRKDLPEWLEDLKSWAAAVVGVSFFIIIHIDLEIPYNDEAWRWAVYALLALTQMVISMAVSRTVPMVGGAIGLFVLAWKIAYEVVDFAAVADGEFKMLAMLAIVALQGIGIIGAAIFYAGRRDEIDKFVRGVLTCKPLASCGSKQTASE